MTAEERIHRAAMRPDSYGVAPGQVWEEIKTGRRVRVLAVSSAGTFARLENTATGQHSRKRAIYFTSLRWRRIEIGAAPIDDVSDARMLACDTSDAEEAR